MRREIRFDIVRQSGIVHADPELNMQSAERFPPAFAAKDQRSRLAFPSEAHDPVEGDRDRRTLDRGAGLARREDPPAKWKIKNENGTYAQETG